MPVILRIEGFRFFFYSLEHPPIHIHVSKGDGDAKIALEPSISVDVNYGFKHQELSRIIEIIEDHYDFLIEKWHEYQD